MKLLALDTATEACSAALLVDDRLSERYEVAPRGHAELLLPMVDALLADAGCRLSELDGLAFGRGPGAFTGLRIAASVAQGLAFGAGLQVFPVSDLAALARHAWRTHGARRVWALIDARMGEVYAAPYEMDAHGVPALVGVETLARATEIAVPPGAGWLLAGSGVGTYGAVLVERLGPPAAGLASDLLPTAQDIAWIAAAGPRGAARAPADAQPVYLRDRVVEPAR